MSGPLSRRQIIVGGGQLVIGFALLGPAMNDASAQSQQRDTANNNRQNPGGSERRNPLVDTWVHINADGTVTILTGKIELGQGLQTALAQIAADELDVSLERIRVVIADTHRTADEGITSGSRSLEESGTAVRDACAEARRIMLEMAAERLDAPVETLVVEDGTIRPRDGDRHVTYFDLLGGERILREITRQAPIKTHERHRFVGQSVPRIDMPDIVTGGSYVQNLRLPGMLHARILRPPMPGARLESLSVDDVSKMPGVVKIVRDGSFVGVIADREEQAIFAWERLRDESRWSPGPALPSPEQVFDHLRRNVTARNVVRDVGDVDQAMNRATRTHRATYTRPYTLHGSMGPSCAIAQLDGDRLTIWSHTQGVFPLRRSIVDLLDMPEQNVRIIGVPGSGCYGHNGADDVAADAALLARALPGRPIRVQWMRADEHMWEPFGSAMVSDVAGGVDDAGNVVAWSFDIWTDTHSTRPNRQAGQLLAAHHLAEPRQARGRGYMAGGHRNAEPLYDFASQRIVAHACDGPFRTSALRSLGAFANVFALESFVDELAHLAKIDALMFRLKHLTDPRGRDVLERAAEVGGWADERPTNHGRGLGFARYKNNATYCAVCAEVAVDPTSGAISVVQLTAAVDAGQCINPDGLRNQTEGGMIQAASWTLREQVRWDDRGITTTNWETYPILRVPDAPRTRVEVIDRPTEPWLGAGEAAAGPTAAAIANAVFKATGTRIRDLPMTPEKLR